MAARPEHHTHHQLARAAKVRIHHEIIGDLHVISARCEATDGLGHRRMSIMAVISDFLAAAAEIIEAQREVFRLTKARNGAMVDLNLTVRVRAVDAVPTVSNSYVPTDPLHNGV